MAKRFTDTTKWKRVWFRKLQPEHKVFWFYLLDQCCHAGIWEVDFEQAEFFCGKLVESEIREVFKKQILEFDNGKRWFIQDFIDFQYGELNDKVNAHRSAINRLKKFKLYNIDELFIKGSSTLDSRVKDKDNDKDKDIIVKRMSEFKKEISAFDYPDELKSDFFDYWSELNKSNTKMRFQLQKTWNLNLRLKRWAGNDFGKKGSNFDYKSLLSVSHKDIQKYEKN